MAGALGCGNWLINRVLLSVGLWDHQGWFPLPQDRADWVKKVTGVFHLGGLRVQASGQIKPACKIIPGSATPSDILDIKALVSSLRQRLWGTGTPGAQQELSEEEWINSGDSDMWRVSR